MKTDEYGRMYELEETHWWFRGLRELILACVVPHLPQGSPVLDCGCGTGIVLKTLEKHVRAIGLDLSTTALHFCKQRHVESTLRASVTELPFSEARFGTLLSLDVLYHSWVVDDSMGLAEYYRVLKPGGRLLLHLPAYRFLSGAHDRAVATARRYTATEIARKVKASGLKLHYLTYRNFFLFPFIAAWRFIQGKGNCNSDLKSIYGPLNALLLQILRIENRLIASRVGLPFGSSVFCIAVKPAD